MADQLRFAQASGDVNPAHVDEIEARRTIFGRPVVHGIHALLWCLDALSTRLGYAARLRSVQVSFVKPVVVGEATWLTVRSEAEHLFILTLHSEVDELARIEVLLEPLDAPSLSGWPSERPGLGQPKPLLFSPALVDMRGELDIVAELDLLRELMPSSQPLLSGWQTAFLVTTTRLVGMEMPGLNSLYSELTLNFGDRDLHVDSMLYKVERVNSIFRSMTISVGAGLARGTIKAFARPEIRPMPTAAEAVGRIAAGRFAGQRALVVGGSRGLGALTAQLLAVSGAEVVTTYARGRDEAERLASELKTLGHYCLAARFDIEDDTASLSEMLPAKWTPTHVYYFATPFIFAGSRRKLSPTLLNRFMTHYVTGFWRVFEQAQALGDLRAVVYPSSSALDELPPAMLEYAVAKAAGETLVAYINQHYPKIEVHKPRFGRMDTDQTVSLMPVANADPIPVLVNLLNAADPRTSSS